MNEMTVTNPITTLLPIPFHDDTVFLADREGQPYVPIRPIVENLGLSWKPQFTKLKANVKRWTVTIMVTVAADGKRRETVCIPLRKFFAFLLSIEPSKVKPAIRHKVEMYQEECDEALWRHWSGEEQQLAAEERMRRIVREELVNFTPPRKAAQPVSDEEKNAIRADILAGAGTNETARKYGRAVSTIRDHTRKERAIRNGQMELFEEKAGIPA